MKKQKKNNSSGITLIALVISIIVMLVLAGVSISALVGENGIVTKAQLATFAQKIASYKEEMELNIVGSADNPIPKRESVTALNESIRKYIKSLKDDDVGKFGIIAGELYYLGDNSREKEVCISQNVKTRADGQSLEEFIDFTESVALEELMKNMAGNSFKVENADGTTGEAGVKLWNKNLENANRWKIITEVENNAIKATYGTDWYYVEKGTKINNIGSLNHSYIINYKTNKAVRFDTSKHAMLSFESTVGVTDNLFFNFDPSVLTEVVKSSNYESLSNAEKLNRLENAMGSGVQLKNMNLDDSGTNITTSEIAFDGVNDAIVIDYSDDAMKNKLKNQGITFECYGIIESGGITLIDADAYNGTMTPTQLAKSKQGQNGILMYTIKNAEQKWIQQQNEAKIRDAEIERQKAEGTYVEPPKVTVNYPEMTMQELYDGYYNGGSVDGLAMRFTFKTLSNANKIEQLYWNLGKGYYGCNQTNDPERYPTYASPNSETSFAFNIGETIEINAGEVVYFTFVLNPNEIVNQDGNQYLVYRIYLNGELMTEGLYNQNMYTFFRDYAINALGEFHIGRTIYNSSQYFYSKLTAYAIRLYSKALTESEVMLNYKNSVSYHEFLVNETAGGTSGNTGGEDIGNID